HCKGVVNHYPLETAGGVQQVRFISEGDLYRLIVTSKLPAAQKFETWVFDEVLPTIRRHGIYAIDELLADDEFLERAITTLRAE
ncbi:BRO family protein, partial [Xanthomonas citri pv. citri]|nr:BRO family protein [Xanthomonas citri pv. citri]